MSEEAVKNFLFYLEDIGLINNIKAQNLLNVYYNFFTYKIQHEGLFCG